MNFRMDIIDSFSSFLWGGPMLVLLLGTHSSFTVRLGGIQRWLPRGIRLSFSGGTKAEKSTDSETGHGAGNGSGHKASSHSGITPYAALATSLAATIGTGNIIGISTAIAIGGPGAVFW
mgnify:FL=1